MTFMRETSEFRILPKGRLHREFRILPKGRLRRAFRIHSPLCFFTLVFLRSSLCFPALECHRSALCFSALDFPRSPSDHAPNFFKHFTISIPFPRTGLKISPFFSKRGKTVLIL